MLNSESFNTKLEVLKVHEDKASRHLVTALSMVNQIEDEQSRHALLEALQALAQVVESQRLQIELLNNLANK